MSFGPQNLDRAISIEVPAVLFVFKKINLYLCEIIILNSFSMLLVTKVKSLWFLGMLETFLDPLLGQNAISKVCH